MRKRVSRGEAKPSGGAGLVGLEFFDMFHFRGGGEERLLGATYEAQYQRDEILRVLVL